MFNISTDCPQKRQYFVPANIYYSSIEQQFMVGTLLLLSFSPQLDKDTRDKREAARKGFKMRVDEITQKMERYTDELKVKEGSLAEMTENLDVVKTRLKEVDEKLRQLRPGIRLDALEDRCKQG